MDEGPDLTGEQLASEWREIAARTDAAAERLRGVVRSSDVGGDDVALDLLMGVTLLAECAHAMARGEFDVADDHGRASVRYSRRGSVRVL